MKKYFRSCSRACWRWRCCAPAAKKGRGADPGETAPTQTAVTGGVDTSCKLYFPNDQASDLRADTVHITDAEATVTVAYAQAIVDQLIAHDALPKDSKVLAISKDGDALSLDMNEAFLWSARERLDGRVPVHGQPCQHLPR